VKDVIGERMRAAETNRKRIGKGATKQEWREFRERVATRDAEFKRRVAMARLDGTERRWARLLRRYYTDATWIMTVHAFPDGRPQREQTQWELALWTVFINALRRAGAGDQSGV